MKHDLQTEPRIGAEPIGMPERQTPEVKALNKLLKRSLSQDERKHRRNRLMNIIGETAHVVAIAVITTSILIMIGAI